VEPGGGRAAAAGLALALPALSIALAHAAFVPVWRTNDDVGMNLLAAGVAYTARPTPLLLFSHHWLGRALNLLYAALPDLPWYRLFGLAVQYASGVAVAWIGLRRRPFPAALFAVGAYFATFDLLAAVRPHFTLVAACAAQAGFLLWRERLRRDAPLSPGWLAAFFLFWGAAALVRYQACALILLLALPSVALEALGRAREGRWRTGLRRVALPFLGVALVAGGLTQLDRLRYAADPAWRDFNETAELLGPLIDFGRGAVGPREQRIVDPRGEAYLLARTYDPRVYDVAREQAGWSPNDYHMLMEWFYADPEVYSAEKLARVLAALPAPPADRLAALEPLGDDPHAPLLLAAALLPLTFVRRGAARRFELGLSGLAFVGLCAWLVLGLGRFPSWVYQPMLGFLAGLGLVHGGGVPLRGAARSARLWLRVVLCGVVLGSALASQGVLRGESRAARAESRALAAALGRLAPSADELYVIWGAEFPWQSILPTDSLDPLRGLRVYSVGADTRAPFNREQLARSGIADVYRAIYEQPGVRVISDDRLNRMFVEFVRRHRGAEVRPRELARFAGLFSVYRFERLDAAD
jgi:hypothetical protein